MHAEVQHADVQVQLALAVRRELDLDFELFVSELGQAHQLADLHEVRRNSRNPLTEAWVLWQSLIHVFICEGSCSKRCRRVLVLVGKARICLCD